MNKPDWWMCKLLWLYLERGDRDTEAVIGYTATLLLMLFSDDGEEEAVAAIAALSEIVDGKHELVHGKPIL